MIHSRTITLEPTLFMLSALLLVVLFAPLAGATPISDGRFDVSEGYTTSQWVVFDKDKADAQLYTYRNAVTGDLSVALVQPSVYVDNTYGTNANGWGSGGHTFNDLLGSDKGVFKISDTNGNLLIDLTIDYIDKDGKDSSGNDIFASEAKFKAPKAPKGSPKPPKPTIDPSQFGTSLDYNFNTLGHVLTVDSPLADSNYNLLDPQYAGWIFESVYEFTIAATFLAGATDLVFDINAHNSPNKGMRATPIPGAVWLLGTGLFGLIGLRRRVAK